MLKERCRREGLLECALDLIGSRNRCSHTGPLSSEEQRKRSEKCEHSARTVARQGAIVVKRDGKSDQVRGRKRVLDRVRAVKTQGKGSFDVKRERSWHYSSHHSEGVSDRNVPERH